MLLPRQTPALILLTAFGLSVSTLTIAQTSNNFTTEIDCLTDKDNQNNAHSKSQNSAAPPTENQQIDSINIVVKPIFDENNPKESNWLFRLANRLHIPTRKKVIRDDLLFKVGSPIDQNLLNSSERSLNTRRYLNQAKVEQASKHTLF
ncbi:MAG: hypothetical protein P1U47_10895 [Zhongshania sp.]|uniref:hypothetical protein n=1 Tax=Zhongshania sp. TaxID=1971902 RepID=UPI002616DBAE|nr:hypothetical protein [Zhongshania sp.]MDF1692874.1 hypothetical protein [Zhongshania sp.]